MTYTVQYPSAVPAATAIYSKTNDVDFVKAEDFDGLRGELAAVCATLGVNPQGAYDSVVARLNAGGSGGYTAETTLSAPWKTLSDFTLDNNSHTLDLSSLAPSGAKAVILSCKMLMSSGIGGIYFYKEYDYSEIVARNQSVTCSSTSISVNRQIICNLSNTKTISYDGSGSFNTLDLSVIGFLS